MRRVMAEAIISCCLDVLLHFLQLWTLSLLETLCSNLKQALKGGGLTSTSWLNNSEIALLHSFPYQFPTSWWQFNTEQRRQRKRFLWICFSQLVDKSTARFYLIGNSKCPWEHTSPEKSLLGFQHQIVSLHSWLNRSCRFLRTFMGVLSPVWFLSTWGICCVSLWMLLTSRHLPTHHLSLIKILT